MKCIKEMKSIETEREDLFSWPCFKQLSDRFNKNIRYGSYMGGLRESLKNIVIVFYEFCKKSKNIKGEYKIFYRAIQHKICLKM